MRCAKGSLIRAKQKQPNYQIPKRNLVLVVRLPRRNDDKCVTWPTTTTTSAMMMMETNRFTSRECIAYTDWARSVKWNDRPARHDIIFVPYKCNTNVNWKRTHPPQRNVSQARPMATTDDQLIGQLLTVSVNDSTCISNNNNVCMLNCSADVRVRLLYSINSRDGEASGWCVARSECEIGFETQTACEWVVHNTGVGA